MMTSELRKILALLWAGNAQLGPNPTVEQLRAAMGGANAGMPLSPGVNFRDVREDGVAGIWCETADAIPNRVILYFHGGGYIAGSAEAWRGMTGELCRLAKTRLFSVDYRLAPEHPFPAALDDALAAYRWLLAQGVPARSIVIAGDSAGGGLCVAALFAAREANLPLPAAVFLISPWMDQDITGASIVTKASVEPLATPAVLRGMANAYLGERSRRDPLASPLYGNLEGLPPMLIQVGSEEALLDDSVRFAGLAGAAKVHVQLEIFPEMFHEFQGWHSMLSEARRALSSAAKFINDHQ